jgi:hypothetical protein
MRSKSDIHHTIHEQEFWPLQVSYGTKVTVPAVLDAVAWSTTGPPNFSCRNTQCVQSVHITGRSSGNFLGGGYYIQRARRRVDDRRAGNPELRSDGRTFIPHFRRHLSSRNCGHPACRIDKAGMPHRSRRGAVRIPRVYGVMFGGHKHQVVNLRSHGHTLTTVAEAV